MARPLRVLLIGGGGREHAIAWQLCASPLVERVYVAPGNGGTAGLSSSGKCENVPVAPDAFDALVAFAVERGVRLVVPGPEQAIVDGIKDYFSKHAPADISVFCCSRACARLEGSKAFAKRFMEANGIPTARYRSFSDVDEAREFLEAHQDTRWVLKADGLAAGKGVLLPATHAEALAGLDTIFVARAFGDAGATVVVEEFLEGEELSVLSFSDGYSVRSLPAAQDHKRVYDNDEGPNTGGMGCYAPAAVCTPAIRQELEAIVARTIDGVRDADRSPYLGVLFTGFMLTAAGPRVLEYNCRMGDPETQTLLPLLDTDLAEIMLACVGGYLSAVPFRIKPASSATVVVAAGGYPASYEKNTPMTIASPADPDIVHFHAGTAVDSLTKALKTSGGRVIAATAVAPTIQLAVQKAYEGVKLIDFEGMHFRKDIAHRELNRSKVAKAANGEVSLTYASSGVSVAGGNAFVEAIKGLVRSTRRPGADSEIGGFGGAINLSAAGYGADSILFAAIDGIGTKLILSRQMQHFSTIGIDLVAMNVNDLVVAGAEPIAFLDYYACGRLEADVAVDFVRGVVDGCKEAGCALVGGETAEMPGVYGQERGEFDAAGVAIGAVSTAQKDTVLPRKEAMRQGDILLGLASSGVHSNGFSLVRRIVERSGVAYEAPAPWADARGRSLGMALLEPTRIYVKSLLGALRKEELQGKIYGMAHITGGGLMDNIPRMLPTHLAARIDVGAWPVPGVLRWLKAQGRLTHREFATTFNTGLGMVLAVAPDAADSIVQELQAAGETVCRVGELVARSEPAEGCILHNVEAWDAL